MTLQPYRRGFSLPEPEVEPTLDLLRRVQSERADPDAGTLQKLIAALQGGIRYGGQTDDHEKR
jgi:hypothetical protein